MCAPGASCDRSRATYSSARTATISAWTINSPTSKPAKSPTPSPIRRAIAISSTAQNKPTLSSYPPKNMRLTECIVAHALVRAASRLVSTLACEFAPHLNKRRDGSERPRGESRHRRPGACATISLIFAIFVTSAFASPLTPKQRQLNIDSFEYVWTAIRDKHWETKPAGLDWQAIHDEFRPAIEKADSMEAARAVI